MPKSSLLHWENNNLNNALFCISYNATRFTQNFSSFFNLLNNYCWFNKKNCHMDFAISTDHRKLKVKTFKHLDLARVLIKLWNMAVIPIVVGALCLEKTKRTGLVLTWFLLWYINLHWLFNTKAIFVKEWLCYLTYSWWWVKDLIPFPMVLVWKEL